MAVRRTGRTTSAPVTSSAGTHLADSPIERRVAMLGRAHIEMALWGALLVSVAIWLVDTCARM
jgi:hypothetical protein